MANKTRLSLDDLARLLDERLTEANTEIRKLLKRVTELEEHVKQQDLRIKSLESKTVGQGRDWIVFYNRPMSFL